MRWSWLIEPKTRSAQAVGTGVGEEVGASDGVGDGVADADGRRVPAPDPQAEQAAMIRRRAAVNRWRATSRVTPQRLIRLFAREQPLLDRWAAGVRSSRDDRR